MCLGWMTRLKCFAVGFKIDIRICLNFQTAYGSVASVTSCSKYCARFEQKETETTELAVPRMDDAVEVLCRRIQSSTFVFVSISKPRTALFPLLTPVQKLRSF